MSEKAFAFYDAMGKEVFVGDTCAVKMDDLYEEGVVSVEDGEFAIANGGYLYRDYGDCLFLVKSVEETAPVNEPQQTIAEYILAQVDALDKIEEEEQISAIAEAVTKKFQVQCDYFHAGGFDSPGYDVECYVIAFLDEQGKLQGQSVEIERY